MAYQLTTATSVSNLLDNFRSFASTNGWTINRWVTAGSGKELCISKGTAFFNFRAYENETAIINGTSGSNKTGIGINGSDAFNSGDAWDRQVGYPLRGNTSGGDQGHVYVPMVLTTGPFNNCYFFSPDSKSLYCCLEIITGTCIHFGVTSLDLFNTAASGGGRCFWGAGGKVSVTNSTASNTWLGSLADNSVGSLELVPFRLADYGTDNGSLSGSMVRVGYSSFNNWAGSGRTITAAGMQMACQGGGVHDKIITACSPSPLNNLGVLTPNIVALNISDSFLAPIGTIPGIRYLDMTSYNIADEFTLGSDTWKVFPWYSKGGLSLNRGIAYLKVV